MEKKDTKMQIPKITLDDLFSTQEQRDNANLEKVIDIKIDEIDNLGAAKIRIRSLLAAMQNRGENNGN